MNNTLFTAKNRHRGSAVSTLLCRGVIRNLYTGPHRENNFRSYGLRVAWGVTLCHLFIFIFYNITIINYDFCSFKHFTICIITLYLHLRLLLVLFIIVTLLWIMSKIKDEKIKTCSTQRTVKKNISLYSFILICID